MNNIHPLIIEYKNQYDADEYDEDLCEKVRLKLDDLLESNLKSIKDDIIRVDSSIKINPFSEDIIESGMKFLLDNVDKSLDSLNSHLIKKLGIKIIASINITFNEEWSYITDAENIYDIYLSCQDFDGFHDLYTSLIEIPFNFIGNWFDENSEEIRILNNEYKNLYLNTDS